MTHLLSRNIELIKEGIALNMHNVDRLMKFHVADVTNKSENAYESIWMYISPYSDTY